MSTTTGHTTVLDVEGMTCGNCVKHVTSELQELSDVTDVSVELRTGAVSPVTVVSEAPLDDDTLREAVDEAGYSVAAIRRG